MSDFEEKVLKKLESIEEKLEKLLNGGVSSAASPAAGPSPGGTVKPSEIVEKIKEEERLEEKPPVEGRRVCPECGGTSFRTEEDKSTVLHQMGGVKIYAKINVCKQCGAKM